MCVALLRVLVLCADAEHCHRSSGSRRVDNRKLGAAADAVNYILYVLGRPTAASNSWWFGSGLLCEVCYFVSLEGETEWSHVLVG